MNYKEIESLLQFKKHYQKSKEFKHFAFQNIDFMNVVELMENASFADCIFLGCKLPGSVLNKLIPANYIFPQLNVPYNCYPSKLYTSSDLYNNYQLGKPETFKQCFDYHVYEHYLKTGKEATSINETLARRLHDHAITDALYDFISNYDEKHIVAIMGGHALNRNEPAYFNIALLSMLLSKEGFLMVTGGGPGAMEATHLGVWFAGREKNELKDAIKTLGKAPDYKSKGWLNTAFEVINKYPQKEKKESLGIPTWLYGHEPATPFATKIAKYFANSVREDGLLTIAKGGVIFSPGSAGTVQEIFQDATQNHYLSFGYSSPMIFFGKDFWTQQFPVYSFLKGNLQNGNYKNLLLSITESNEEVAKTLKEFSSL
jgi:predicted Rossmann-fold nucleotide-binding protein